MARLKSHGKELLRIVRENDVNDNDRSIDWQRETRAYMSDGKILSKYDVRFKPDTYNPTGERYSYGWKLFAKVKAGHNVQDVVEQKKIRIASGQSVWQLDCSGNYAKPVILNQKQIMAAAERDDNTGFCRACGAEVDGCEPDARGYQCESCGEFQVYGASELLMSM